MLQFRTILAYVHLLTPYWQSRVSYVVKVGHKPSIFILCHTRLSQTTWSLWYDLQLPLPSTNVKVTIPEEAKDLRKTQKVTSKKNISTFLPPFEWSRNIFLKNKEVGIKDEKRASALRTDIARGISGLLVTYPIDPTHWTQPQRRSSWDSQLPSDY